MVKNYKFISYAVVKFQIINKHAIQVGRKEKIKCLSGKIIKMHVYNTCSYGLRTWISCFTGHIIFKLSNSKPHCEVQQQKQIFQDGKFYNKGKLSKFSHHFISTWYRSSFLQTWPHDLRKLRTCIQTQLHCLFMKKDNVIVCWITKNFPQINKSTSLILGVVHSPVRVSWVTSLRAGMHVTMRLPSWQASSSKVGSITRFFPKQD